MLAEIIPKIAGMDQKEYKFSPRPSSAGPEKCIRQMVYHGLNVPREPLPGRAMLVFDDGNWHEELTLDWLRKSTYNIHSEQMELDCRAPMKKGHIDGIVTDILGIDRLLEHKALNHFTFQRFWNGELPIDYLAQCSIYMDALRAINPEINEFILLIKNKNNAQYIEFRCHYQWDRLTIIEKVHSNGERESVDIEVGNIVTDACDKFNSVLDYIKNKKLPKRQYDIDHWRCEYCQWSVTCWAGYEKEFAELKTNEMLPNEVADAIRYYKELGAQKKDITAEYDDLRKTVKKIMVDSGIREGKAGEYICKIKLIETDKIDPSLLTEKEREKATKKGFQERITISKIKEKAA